ncbi:uncharacterized protein cubi_02029 [Cryptosporidium ubiquitum]|uniref:Uncharacterized protein n=1 Tax=Cryptosporidium ubiquitum TaxID=857276 RepID=A0A1J4MR83_9CRYT|nr:uncharacterized protein cubi_02029 [Cryptosporidium ubiquitum]OII75508.1 hypothetical protein cubi_02029 [Cryptosporidium ubiquitum]
MIKLSHSFIIACILVYILNHFEQIKIESNSKISLLRIKVKEKGFLSRAANAAGRVIFGIDTTPKEQPINTERIPVGMFPDPKELAQELDMLENRKISPDSNRQFALKYVTDVLNGQTPNMELLSNSQMAQVSSGVFDRGSQEALSVSNKTKIAEMQANKEKEQALQSQGQIIKDGEQIKIGKQGPVTLNDPDENNKGKTIPPNLALVDEEEKFVDKVADQSIFSHPLVIISIFILVVCMFAGGGLVYFKIIGKKKRKRSS